MKRKITSVFTALLAAILITSTVFAGSIKLSRVTFSLGTDTTTDSGGFTAMSTMETSGETTSSPTLGTQGTMTGLGEQDVRVVLVASGLPVVSCTNLGSNMAPGQNPSKVTAFGEIPLTGDVSTTNNGRYLFGVQTEQLTELDPIVYGCPNENWTASIDFVFWEIATIKVLDAQNEEVVLFTQDYTCATTLNSVTCTPVK
jgi:hypothetical protein